MLVGGAKEKTLDELRFYQYYRKLGATNKAFSPKMLCPTSDAGSLHIMRVYHQVQVWKGVTNLEISEWGWMRNKDLILPVPMTKGPGPSNLLKMIRCSCQGYCSGRCTCHSLRIKCSFM